MTHKYTLARNPTFDHACLAININDLDAFCTDINELSTVRGCYSQLFFNAIRANKLDFAKKYAEIFGHVDCSYEPFKGMKLDDNTKNYLSKYYK
jgi:hypothetical protein